MLYTKNFSFHNIPIRIVKKFKILSFILYSFLFLYAKQIFNIEDFVIILKNKIINKTLVKFNGV